MGCATSTESVDESAGTPAPVELAQTESVKAPDKEVSAVCPVQTLGQPNGQTNGGGQISYTVHQQLAVPGTDLNRLSTGFRIIPGTTVRVVQDCTYPIEPTY